MQFTLRYSGNFFEIKIVGLANPKIYADSLDSLFMQDKWKPGSPLLLDETEMDASQIPVGDVERIAKISALRKTEFGASRCALVVSRDLEYGMNRMWMVFVENKWDVMVELFRSREEAIAWLTAKQTFGEGQQKAGGF
jgi:hypothetical protein